MNMNGVVSDECLNFFFGTVPPSDPDDERWSTKELIPIVEIIVFRHDRESIIQGIIPDLIVIFVIER